MRACRQRELVLGWSPRRPPVKLCVSLYAHMHIYVVSQDSLEGTAQSLTEIVSMQTLLPTRLMHHKTMPQTYESLMCELENSCVRLVCVSRVTLYAGLMSVWVCLTCEPV